MIKFFIEMPLKNKGRILTAMVGCLAILMTSGCGVFGTLSGVGVDNTPPPKKLTNVSQRMKVNGVWMVSSGASLGADSLKLGPIVSNNIVFTADPKGGVQATNPKNGKRVWWTNLSAPITSGPTVKEGLVVVGTAKGQVFALRENNGATLWHVTVPNSILAAPQISQGRVIVKTLDGKLIALSAENGQQLWLYDHGAPTMVMRKDNTPQVYGNSIITGFADGKVAAFSLDQGKLLWEQNIGIDQGASQTQQMVDILADPVIANGNVYVSNYQGSLTAINAKTGSVVWEKDTSSGGFTNLVLASDLLFTTDTEDNIKAFDCFNGELVWSQSQLNYRHLSPLMTYGNSLVVGDGEGYLHWFSQNTGEYIGRNAVGSAKISAVSQPLNNYLFVASNNGSLSAWRVG